MSIKIDALASGPFTIAAGGSGGGSLSAINNGTIGIQSGDTVQGRMVSVEKTYSIDEIERLGLNT
ncbi:MAG: hypothetical protein RL463_1002, partial [Bacteroidota bacterium]